MTDEITVESLLEQHRIAEVVNALFVATDARDWKRVRDCFAPRVSFDMTSLAGGAVQELSPEEIAAGWETGLAPIDAVHHQVGNLSIRCEGTDGNVSCYGIAYHYRATRSGRNTRVFVGSYDFHLVRQAGSWRIDVFRLHLKFIDGNRELEREDPA
jgi:hypothetical protein